MHLRCLKARKPCILQGFIKKEEKRRHEKTLKNEPQKPETNRSLNLKNLSFLKVEPKVVIFFFKKANQCIFSAFLSCGLAPRSLLFTMNSYDFSVQKMHFWGLISLLLNWYFFQGLTDQTTNKPTDRPTDRPTNRPTDRKCTGTQTNKQIGRASCRERV